MIFSENNKDFEPGTVIKRTCGLTGAWHYGIVVEGNNVIHFNKDLIKATFEPKIIKTSLSDFAKWGAFLRECEILKNKYKYSKEEVVERAYSMLDTDFGGYNLVNNNCETFCRWAISGDRISIQVILTKCIIDFVTT